MNKLRILHLADLHFKSNIPLDLRYLTEKFIEDLEKFSKTKTIDIIIFSGDIVQMPGDGDKEYMSAYNLFFKKILEITNLTNDDLFFAPGNHDLNRNSIKKRKEKSGFLSYGENPETINELAKEIIEGDEELIHFKQYNDFVNNLKNTNCFSSNNLYKTYKKSFSLNDKRQIKIGIACLNSSILAFDNEFEYLGKTFNSYGNQIISELQLKESFKDIKDCDIKIANLHYNTNWLKDFEQRSTKKFLLEHYNLVYFGHEHQELEELVCFNDNDTLMLNAASLYQGRKKVNGYSILEYDFSEGLCNLIKKEYDKEDDKFKEFKNFEKNYTFDILKKSIKLTIENVIDDIKNNYANTISQKTLYNIAKNDNKKIEEIFIELELHNESEYLQNSGENKKRIYIEEILNNDLNYIIHGINTSGKTTLLNYIANSYLDYKSLTIRIPIYINILDLGKYKESYFKAECKDFLASMTYICSDQKYNDLLNKGTFLFLIDDVDLSIPEHFDLINTLFIENRYKNNRFILASNEDAIDTLQERIDNDKKSIKNLNLEEIYIYTFRRNNTRKFFKFWMKDKYNEKIFQDIFEQIISLNIPSTPFIYTLVAYIYENTFSFKAKNDAYLLEIFFEHLLERLDINKNLLNGSVDYQLKLDYLTTVAEEMVNLKKLILTNTEINKITNDYFININRNDLNVNNFLNYMIEKGIFIKLTGDNIRFRFKAFLEFFIAKKMQKDKLFKDKIIQKNQLSKYKNEIIYYSGIVRDDESLMEWFYNLFNENEYKIFFKRENIEKIEIIKSIVPDIDFSTNDLLSIKPLDIDELDKISESDSKKVLEVNNSNAIKKKEKIFSNNSENNSNKFYFENNVLFSNVLKNLELVKKPEMKYESVKISLNNFIKLIENYFTQTKPKFFKHFRNKILNNPKIGILEEDLNEIFFLLDSVITHGIINLTNISLSVKSLENIMIDIYENEKENDISIKLLIVFILLNSSSNKSVDFLENLITNNIEIKKNKFILWLFIMYIYNNIKLGKINNHLSNKLKIIITDIIILMGGNNKIRKSSYKGKLQKDVDKKIEEVKKENDV